LSEAQRNLEGYRLLNGPKIELAGQLVAGMRIRFTPVG
jgi:hypothetical protein